MQITFAASADSSTPRLVARVVDQDSLPSDLSRSDSEGAAAARFTGKPGQLFESFAESDGRVVRQVLVGAGKADAEGCHAALEKAGAALAARYMTSGETALALDVSGGGLDAAAVAAVLTGLRLRTWRYDVYRTKMKDEQKVTLAEVVVIGAPAGTEAAWEVEQAVASGVELTRELVAEPANVIYPETFVERVSKRLEGTGAEVSFLGEDEMRAFGMGALLGVSQGSIRDARLLVIKWMGGEEGTAPTVFVGKGVTFDTGGISLKPPAGMEDMKWDMGGAGAVAGAMLAIAGRKAKANVIGVCGLVENMPDGNAQRPGDIVTTMSGQTVEVINTDAEGRLVLCDAMWWAQKEFKPAAVVDLATLTGAMIISLGHEHAGLFSNDDTLSDNLLKAGKQSGDKLWRFPLSPEYDKLIDSPIADMKNVGPRYAGSITAAQYLQRFVVDGTPWAHLDIAGMAWADKPGQTWGKGATGYGVRLIDTYVRNVLEG
ncbi:leucyl aminopeptidase [Altererythrobacter salegens]|uniref:Probable cytosol aminopeptidase n=1 Tax=Croceibacterium salegens TaxID=1737568 RepID=A0A6I4SQS9_9SPHN|nr:leucyl aminopeptidase [Croceibacterium salegens]MXO58301.1 leucyl aminopeptidase [Croceibacterium salegens]